MRQTRKVALGPKDVAVERRAGGILHLRSPHSLGPYPRKLTERLEHWAEIAPYRVFLAHGERTLTYAQALERAKRVGQYLLDKKLSAERPLVVLSGNDIEHALLHLGAMYVGVPYAPISPAYSLLSTDFAKLRFIRDLLTPGLVFANGPQYAKALEAFRGIEVLEAFDQAARTPPTSAVEDAHRGVG